MYEKTFSTGTSPIEIALHNEDYYKYTPFATKYSPLPSPGGGLYFGVI